MFSILYEDNHCLVVDKPAGMLAQADESGDPCMVELAKADLKRRYQKPGNVYLGLVHRLDRTVSGVLLLAKTSKAAARLAESFRAGRIEKLYWAVVEGRIPEPRGEWRDLLRKDDRRNIVEVVTAGCDAGKEARLVYRVLECGLHTTKVELRPLTGRGHQLRVQLSTRGWPIVGDRKYGATTILRADDGHHRIALHARSLRFKHPTRPEEIEVIAPVPADWPDATKVGR